MSRIFSAFLLIFSPPSAGATPGEPLTAESRGGMVVCVSPPAADVGAAALGAGGNAVDAAVAVAFAEAVTWPEAGNIGGGGFMMVAAPGKPPTCFDYRETAPAAATRDMFADGKTTSLDHKAAGVPGPSAGWRSRTRRTASSRGRPWSCPRSNSPRRGSF